MADLQTHHVVLVKVSFDQEHPMRRRKPAFSCHAYWRVSCRYSHNTPEDFDAKLFAYRTAFWYKVKVKEMLKNGVFWHVTPCGSCKNRRFEGT
jgi:hypothetical protein